MTEFSGALLRMYAKSPSMHEQGSLRPTPEGIAVAPSGQRAYVTDQTAGVVEELDVDVTSALYRHVLREIPVPNAILAGGIAIDPRRERLVLTTKNLGMVSVDLDSTEIVTTLSSQVGGAGVAVTPGGNRVLAVAPAPDAGTILFANATCLPLLGYQPVELIGKPIELLVPVTDDFLIADSVSRALNSPKNDGPELLEPTDATVSG